MHQKLNLRLNAADFIFYYEYEDQPIWD